MSPQATLSCLKIVKVGYYSVLAKEIVHNHCILAEAPYNHDFYLAPPHF